MSNEPFTPSDFSFPPAPWRVRAEAFVKTAHDALMRKKDILAYLAARGVTLEAVRAFRVGFHPRDSYESRERWGLPPDGDRRRVWIPAGVTIPARRDGLLVRVRVRRMSGDPRYWAVAGSVGVGAFMPPRDLLSESLDFEGWQFRVIIITESELDALALWGLPDLRNRGLLVVGLGSAALKPDAALHAVLMAARLVVLIPDFDGPGQKAAKWWLETYPNVKIWPTPPPFKDVGEMFEAQKGVVQKWLNAGISP